MCMMANRTEGTMVHLRNGLVVVKSENNGNMHKRVNLTRKTTRSGAVRYAVTLTSHRSGRNIKLRTFDNILEAWGLYKALRSA